jgi:hypothetical protein
MTGSFFSVRRNLRITSHRPPPKIVAISRRLFFASHNHKQSQAFLVFACHGSEDRCRDNGDRYRDSEDRCRDNEDRYRDNEDRYRDNEDRYRDNEDRCRGMSSGLFRRAIERR